MALRFAGCRARNALVGLTFAGLAACPAQAGLLEELFGGGAVTDGAVPDDVQVIPMGRSGGIEVEGGPIHIGMMGGPPDNMMDGPPDEMMDDLPIEMMGGGPSIEVMGGPSIEMMGGPSIEMMGGPPIEMMGGPGGPRAHGGIRLGGPPMSMHLIPVSSAVGFGPLGPVGLHMLPVGHRFPMQALSDDDDEDPFSMFPFQNIHHDIFSELEHHMMQMSRPGGRPRGGGLLGRPREATVEPGSFGQGLQLFGDAWPQAGAAGGFRVEKEKGHFKLTAILPGYKMHNKDQKDKDKDKDKGDDDQPLHVEVLGHCLVVRGKKTKDESMSSFQRSFRLPKAANESAIKVTYNVTDGDLRVDIPPKAGMESDDTLADVNDPVSERTESYDPRTGVHSTVIKMDASRGASLMGGDIFGMMDEMMGAMGDGPPRPKLKLRQDAKSKVGAKEGSKDAKQDGIKLVSHKEPSAELPSKPHDDKRPSDEATPSRQPTNLVATDKANSADNAHRPRPYWRRPVEGGAETASAIEIVVPGGINVGTINGRQVPCYDNKGIQLGSNQPTGEPDWTVDLPVSVKQEDCSWTPSSEVQERVLRCTINAASVRKVPIEVIDDDEL